MVLLLTLFIFNEFDASWYWYAALVAFLIGEFLVTAFNKNQL